MTRSVGHAAFFIAIFALAGCEPMGPLPGGKLSGRLSPPPTVWTDADSVEVVQLETRPSDPYSVNVWGVGIGPDYYIASGRGGNAKWVEHIAADPNVRLQVGPDMYELRAMRVTDAAEIQRVDEHYAKKYHQSEAEMQEAARQAWLFRLDPRERQ
jgi:hypothetical protein